MSFIMPVIAPIHRSKSSGLLQTDPQGKVCLNPLKFGEKRQLVHAQTTAVNHEPDVPHQGILYSLCDSDSRPASLQP